MASQLRQLLDRIFPSATHHKVLISGIDCSGKTTLLYLLKLGEIISTIPTIGFNVERTTVATSSKNLTIEGWDVGFGCAGISFAMRMLRYYVHNAKAVIWMVDSGDKERMDESVDFLTQFLLDGDAQLAEAGDNRHLPILILANKADLPNAMPVDDIRKKFANATKGRLVSVHAVSLVHKPPKGLTEAFDWLSIALDIAGSSPKGGLPNSAAGSGATAKSSEKPVVHNPRDPELLSQRLYSWLERAGRDEPPEEFINKFNTLSLPSWDHYTHIRIAYLLLAAHGRQKGKDLIFEGLASYIANSSQTNTRAFHLTMTYFWIQIVHFCIRNMAPLESSDSQAPSAPVALEPSVKSDEGPSNSNASGVVKYPSVDEFFKFLVINPYVVDGGLWMDFYSKEVIMTPEAKESMVLPDKKPLPNLVIRDAIKSGVGKV